MGSYTSQGIFAGRAKTSELNKLGQAPAFWRPFLGAASLGAACLGVGLEVDFVADLGVDRQG